MSARNWLCSHVAAEKLLLVATTRRQKQAYFPTWGIATEGVRSCWRICPLSKMQYHLYCVSLLYSVSSTAPTKGAWPPIFNSERQLTIMLCHCKFLPSNSPPPPTFQMSTWILSFSFNMNCGYFYWFKLFDVRWSIWMYGICNAQYFVSIHK